MSNNKLEFITENDTVYDVITKYPELKQVLIEINDKYKRLNNPIIFNTVAKTTTLKVAAKVGNIYVKDLVYKLNEAIGKEKEYMEYVRSQIPKMQKEFLDKFNNNLLNNEKKPDWINKSNEFKILDLRNKNIEPFNIVTEEAFKLGYNKGIILIQNFAPLPLKTYLENNGFSCYLEKISENEYKLFIYKK